MIKVLTQEYKEGDLAVRLTKVTFLYIPIYKSKRTTTNRQAVSLLTVKNKSNKIKGFNNETTD